MNTLSRWATGRNIVILLVIFLFINLVLVPAVYPKFQTLDTSSGYTVTEAYRYLSSYGADGRQLYLVIELTLDLVYPFTTALLFSLLTLATFRRAFPTLAWTHKLALTPFAVMLADYLENASIVTMLVSYPRQLPAVAAAANIFTISKFDLAPFQLLFLVGLAVWGLRALGGRLAAGRRGQTPPSAAA